MVDIKRYHGPAFRKFQSAALAEKGGKYQEDILHNAKNMGGAEFVSWMESEIRQHSPDGVIVEGEEELPIPDKPEKFSAQEFKQLPPTTANILWQEWKNVNPGLFCSPSVWGYITSRFLAAERIKPYFLMIGKTSGQSTGEGEIDTALSETPEKRDKAIDGCVRAFLRRLSGIHERGARSLYQDCPIAVTWWQHYMANEIAGDIQGDSGEVFELLRTPSLWADLTEKMASKLTIIGDRKVRGGLVLFLLAEKDARKHQHLDKLIKDIGIMSGWRALGFFEPAEMRDIIANEIYPFISQQTGTQQ